MISKDAVMNQPVQMRQGKHAADAVGEPEESIEQMLDRLCAIIPDHPEPGITFRDLTPVFADAEGLHRVVNSLAEPFAGEFDAVAGLEARGFLLASAVAYAAGVGLMTVRKGGKLPREVYSREYQLEYGTATLEVHRDALPKGGRVLLVDMSELMGSPNGSNF